MAPVINSVKSASFVLRNVEVWGLANNACSTERLDVYVNAGVVSKIRPSERDGSPANSVTVLDGAGLVLMPAGVDAQVHLRVPGQPQKETAQSGLRAAVHGGVGALLTMPNTKPVIDHPDACEMTRSELRDAEHQTGVKVLLSAAITMGQRGRELVDFEGLKRCGIAAFTDDGVGVADDALMLEALRGVARTGLPLLQHAEVPGHGAVLAPGPTQKLIGGQAYPETVETEMVARDLRLLEQVPEARYHVLHVSSAATLELVRVAKKRGLAVTCEVSPHHLYFTSDSVTEDNTSFKMNPPLRSPVDRAALQEALASGLCDFMATDHAPHEPEAKSRNFKTSAFGTTGLETSFRVLLWMWQRRMLSTKRLIEAWSSAPAKFLGIESAFGSIEVGKPFYGILIDPWASDRCVASDDFAGFSRNSCFIGTHLPGKIHKTFLKDWIHHL